MESEPHEWQSKADMNGVLQLFWLTTALVYLIGIENSVKKVGSIQAKR